MLLDQPASASGCHRFAVLLDRELRHLKRGLRLREDILHAHAASFECKFRSGWVQRHLLYQQSWLYLAVNHIFLSLAGSSNHV